MELVIVYSSDEEIPRRLFAAFPCVELGPGLAVTWEPEDRARRLVERAKEEAIRRWEDEGEGPRLELAVIPLTEEQYNAIRHIVRRALDESAERLAAELRRLAADIRRRKGSPKELKSRFRRLAERAGKLMDAAARLGVEPSAVADLHEAFKEANSEVQKL
ncbi:MAG: hypothetical protein TU35_006075 [Thermoproteus sp. AZ2]|uniref:Uncharacterized protein n=1 Tax=Thermoproteus sp. AZ2 TaxID=1609232 RepID=A0ACC6V1I2_9CREN|nr:MAG: hypothetical protein TU35_04620 [Thermoproteus sp. AZ2]